MICLLIPKNDGLKEITILLVGNFKKIGNVVNNANDRNSHFVEIYIINFDDNFE